MGLPVCWNRTSLVQRLCCTSVIQRPSMRSCLLQRSLLVNMRWWCWRRCFALTQNTGQRSELLHLNMAHKGIHLRSRNMLELLKYSFKMSYSYVSGFFLKAFCSRWDTSLHLTGSLQVQVLSSAHHLLSGSGRLSSATSATCPVGQGARGTA